MDQWRDLVALNAAWVTLEVAKITDVIEGALSIVGAGTLLAINVMRLRREWRKQPPVDKSE